MYMYMYCTLHVGCNIFFDVTCYENDSRVQLAVGVGRSGNLSDALHGGPETHSVVHRPGGLAYLVNTEGEKLPNRACRIITQSCLETPAFRFNN
jgi:hypothetical protein